jgi:hypothetical protein
MSRHAKRTRADNRTRHQRDEAKAARRRTRLARREREEARRG